LNERHILVKQLFVQANADPYWSYELELEANNNNFPREAVEAFKRIPLEDEMWKTWGAQWGVVTSAYHSLGEFRNELKAARRARKERPESLSRLWYEVRSLCGLGRMKDINRLIEESKALPPQTGYSPGNIMYLAGRDLRAHGFKKESLDVLERARQWYESRPQDEKSTSDSRNSFCFVLMYLERWPEALAVFESLHKEYPSNASYLSNYGSLAAITGDREKAIDISKQLAEIKPAFRAGTPTYYRALIAAFLGEKENAVALLRQAIGQGYTYPSVHGAMAWERLADYPPFIQLMKPKG